MKLNTASGGWRVVGKWGEFQPLFQQSLGNGFVKASMKVPSSKHAHFFKEVYKSSLDSNREKIKKNGIL